MDLNKINSIYFLGIGGIGMSALARYFHHKGIHISGYDKTPTPLTNKLQNEGIEIHFEDDVKQIPDNIDLAIYTPAVPKNLNEFIHLEKSGVHLKKRAEILGALTLNKKTIAVAGTHGKTTVSALIAHLLTQSGIGCTAFLGGISKNYNSNLLISDHAEWMVVEADEYDKSFLQLHPDISVITSADADHLDIYGNLENLKSTFQQYASNIKENGFLVLKKGVDLDLNKLSNINTIQYSGNGQGDFYADEIRLIAEKYTFNLVAPGKTSFGIVSGLPGEINVENAVAAMTAAQLAGVNDDALKSGIGSFLGIERRFDIQVKTEQVIYIDDYAHHPEEIKATVLSVKKMFPDRKVLGIFQPHLFTRTRDFADEFAQSLSLMDEVILLPIYPAREKPIEGINSEMLAQRMHCKEVSVIQKKDLLEQLELKKFDVILTLGAGDIDQLVKPIRDYLNRRRLK